MKEPDDSLFIPAKPGRASEDIALQIEAAIASGKIQAGEKLPSERKLQEQFKTGRGVIREAIRALKQKGLVEIKKGAKGGAFIKEVDAANVSESLAVFLAQHPIDPDHLIEFRESLDRTITILAISKGSQEAKSKLLKDTEVLKEIAWQDEPDMNVLSELDRSLNLQFARLSANPIFEWIMDAIQLGFSSNDIALYEDADFRRKTAKNWYETAHYIFLNEPMKALASISSHYQMLSQRLESKTAKYKGEHHE